MLHRFPLLLIAILSLGGGQHRAEEPKADVEKLIDELRFVRSEGLGFSSRYGGSNFLPYADSDKIGVGLLGGAPPEQSKTMEKIVRLGAEAVPALLKHLDDDRMTALPPVKGMMWMRFPDEFDFNYRTEKETLPLKGKGGDNAEETVEPREYQIRVGDLCFVALGQILNRNFTASRYQATGGLSVSSPILSLSIREGIRAEYAGIDAAKHRERLLADLRSPDYEKRRNGAALRLSFYYPKDAEEPILKQLAVPSYDFSVAQAFALEELYKTPDKAKRRELFDAHIRKYGAPGREGLFLQILRDFHTQKADEEGRLRPPLEEKRDARKCLKELFDFVPKDSFDFFEEYWTDYTKSTFIVACRIDSRKVDEAIAGIMRRAKDEHLTLACMEHLRGRGYAGEIRTIIGERLSQKNLYFKVEFKAMLDALPPVKK